MLLRGDIKLKMQFALLQILATLTLLGCGVRGVDVGPDMRSFSSAIKDGKIGPNTEKVLYEHSTGQPGVITEQWFTGEIRRSTSKLN